MLGVPVDPEMSQGSYRKIQTLLHSLAYWPNLINRILVWRGPRSGYRWRLLNTVQPSYGSPFFPVEFYEQVFKFPAHLNMAVAEHSDTLDCIIHTRFECLTAYCGGR